MKLTLPSDSTLRKDYPIATGCDEYFPAALAGVARHSFLAGARHTPGQPMHHDRTKSGDHADCIRRHQGDLADLLAIVRRMGAEPQRESHPELIGMILDEANAMAWRALAQSQELHERFGGAPLAPAARISAPAPIVPPLNALDMPAFDPTSDRCPTYERPDVEARVAEHEAHRGRGALAMDPAEPGMVHAPTGVATVMQTVAQAVMAVADVDGTGREFDPAD